MIARAMMATLVGLFLIVVPAASKTTLAPGYVEEAGVVYYQASGVLVSGHLVNEGDMSGPYVQDFVGCTFSRVRPETGGGRVQMHGIVDGRNYLFFDFDQFVSPDGVTPSINPQFTLNESLGQDPPVDAQMGVWGEGTLRLMGSNFTDPVSEKDDLYADYYVITDGIQDDKTGAALAKADKGDDEIHLRVRTPDDAVPKTRTFHIERTGDLPAGGFSPNEAYSERFRFENSKLGGTASMQITSSATAPEGMNEFTVAVYSSTGTLLANVTMTPAFGADDGDSVEFPLSEFGQYEIEVRGKVAFSQYALDLTFTPPETMDLHFWWEEVTLAGAAGLDFNQCKDEMGFSTVPGATVGRADPPNWMMELVVVGVIGATATLLLIVKVMTESYSDMTMKKRFGR